MSVITIERKVLQKNDDLATTNRDLFARNGLLVLNIVSSPGAGKTTLLEATIEELRIAPASPWSKVTCRPISMRNASRNTASRWCRS